MIMMKKLLLVLLFVFLLIGGLFFISHYLLFLDSNHALSKKLTNYHWILMIWRYVFYALIITLWPYFVKCVGARQHWQAETIGYFSNQRLKLLGLFAIFEVFFVFNIAGKIFGYL